MKYSILDYNQQKLLKTNLDCVDLVILDYLILQLNNPEIEKRLGFTLNWDIKEGVESHITVSRDFDIRDKNSWSDAVKWHLDMAHEFYFEFTVWIDLYE